MIAHRDNYKPHGFLHLRGRRAVRKAATSTEYILILALVVLPIGLLLPLFLNMLKLYGTRIISQFGLPFP